MTTPSHRAQGQLTTPTFRAQHAKAFHSFQSTSNSVSKQSQIRASNQLNSQATRFSIQASPGNRKPPAFARGRRDQLASGPSGAGATSSRSSRSSRASISSSSRRRAIRSLGVIFSIFDIFLSVRSGGAFAPPRLLLRVISPGEGFEPRLLPNRRRAYRDARRVRAVSRRVKLETEFRARERRGRNTRIESKVIRLTLGGLGGEVEVGERRFRRTRPTFILGYDSAGRNAVEGKLDYRPALR